jgi:two-component system response regulator CpxR
MKSVLIVDDDVKLGSMLREYLERHQIHLEICHNGELGLETASSGQYDLMLLDVTLPDVDGFEVLERLRVYSNLSVMLLTARGQAADRIRGLQLGADDYLPKPFDPEELVARIHAILRRSMPGPATHPSATVPRSLSIGELVIDLSSRSTRYKQRPLDLTDIEFSLLETFARSPGIVLSREELVVRVFERSYHPLDRSLDMHVSRLRRKLNGASVAGNPIKTIRSSGYLFSTSEL